MVVATSTNAGVGVRRGNEAGGLYMTAAGIAPVTRGAEWSDEHGRFVVGVREPEVLRLNRAIMTRASAVSRSSAQLERYIADAGTVLLASIRTDVPLGVEPDDLPVTR